MEEAKKKKWEKIIYWGLFIIILPDLVYLLLLGVEVTSVSSFKIPTESMVPTLIPGDNIYVNKWIMGGRIFDVEESFHQQVEISRLPGIRKLKRNDVIVFNDPYPYRSDTMYMDIKRYYIKRCIALPGDTLEIRNGYFRVNGTDEPLGNAEAQEAISRLKGVPEERVAFNAFPHSDLFGWTIKEFGPYHIPQAGMTVPMDSLTATLYHKLIRWEQKKPVTWPDGKVMLGDSLIHEYTFKENYYFTAGDNGIYSRDSRYWGPVPEPFIVGVASRIWKSVDKYTGEWRSDRFLKTIQ
ncbi:MAG: signal peptidase I [Bacteroides sp.]|nr:signal peptidase I [Bacteroides sp.]